MVFLAELYNFGELPIKVILGRVLKMFETKGSRRLDFLSIGGFHYAVKCPLVYTYNLAGLV